MALEKIKVGEIMHNTTPVSPNASITEVAKIMDKKDIGSVLVTEYNEPIGILTECDILRKVVAKGRDPRMTSVAEVMSSPLISVNKDTDVIEAADIFRKHHIRRLLITDDEGKIIGIITQRNVVRSIPTVYFKRAVSSYRARRKEHTWANSLYPP